MPKGETGWRRPAVGYPACGEGNSAEKGEHLFFPFGDGTCLLKRGGRCLGNVRKKPDLRKAVGGT